MFLFFFLIYPKVAVHMKHALKPHRRACLSCELWATSASKTGALHNISGQQRVVLQLRTDLPWVCAARCLAASTAGSLLTVSISMISSGQMPKSCVCAPARQLPASIHAPACHVQAKAVGQNHRSCHRSGFAPNKQVQGCLPIDRAGFAMWLQIGRTRYCPAGYTQHGLCSHSKGHRLSP